MSNRVKLRQGDIVLSYNYHKTVATTYFVFQDAVDGMVLAWSSEFGIGKSIDHLSLSEVLLRDGKKITVKETNAENECENEEKE